MIWQSLVDFVNVSVSGGFVVAMALICLLQYVVHLHRVNRLRIEQQRCRDELHGVAAQLVNARREQTLSRHENLVLREFLEESDVQRALRSVLEHLVSDGREGCAICLRRSPDDWQIEQSVGLGTTASQPMALDAPFVLRLEQEGAFVLSDAALRTSRLWASLAAGDRTRIRQLYLFGIGKAGKIEGVILTTGLLAPGIDHSQRVSATARLVTAISGRLRDFWRFEEQGDELRTTEAMLSLRGIADRHYDSPLRAIGEFVEQTAARISAERAALFLYLPDTPGQFRALVRCGLTLPVGQKEIWHCCEDSLGRLGILLSSPAHYTSDSLARLEVGSLIGTAFLVPILQMQRTIGLLVFTRRTHTEFDPNQQQLAAWAGSNLGDLIPRVVNQAAVARQARVDSLTQLANRGAFDRQIEAEMSAAHESHQPLSLLLLDLDRFKSVNDRYGHRGGDAVLRAAAALVRDCAENVRAIDRVSQAQPFVARYGGEELAMLLPRLNLGAARRIGEMVCDRLARTPVLFEGEPISITTSIGLATFPDHAETVDELIAAADAALYQAKRNGRNRLEIAEAASAFTAAMA